MRPRRSHWLAPENFRRGIRISGLSFQAEGLKLPKAPPPPPEALWFFDEPSTVPQQYSLPGSSGPKDALPKSQFPFCRLTPSVCHPHTKTSDRYLKPQHECDLFANMCLSPCSRVVLQRCRGALRVCLARVPCACALRVCLARVPCACASPACLARVPCAHALNMCLACATGRAWNI